MHSKFCHPLFIIFRVFFCQAQLQKIFSTAFPLPFFKVACEGTERHSCQRVGSANSCLSSPCTLLAGKRGWQQLPISTIACELAFDPSMKKKKVSACRIILFLGGEEMLRDTKQKGFDKRFITVNIHTQTTQLHKDIHVFHLTYSSEIRLYGLLRCCS